MSSRNDRSLRRAWNLVRCLTLAAVLSVLALGFVACEGGEEEEAPTRTPTATAVSTPQPTTTPTSTASPTLTAEPPATVSPTATAVPTEVAVPVQPRNFADYATVIGGYLTEMGGSASCLTEVFAAWDMPEGEVPSPAHCGMGDTDGDSEDEYVVLLTDPDSIGSGYAPFEGDVVVFDSEDGRYEPTYRASDTSPVTMIGAALVGVDDYNGDGLTEAVITSGDCGAHTCFTDVILLGWDGSNYVDLFAEPLGVAWTTPDEITFPDPDGDGIHDVFLPAGVIGSVGAGPQRDAFLTYAWDGSHYVLTKEEFAPSDALYFAVTDGDKAYAEGDIETAMAHYQRAVEDPTLSDWKEAFGGPGGRGELVPYAQFRLYLAQLSTLAADDTARAQELVDSISELVIDYPTSLHAQAALEFALAYPDGEVSASALTTGCAAFLAFVDENQELFDEIWYYGYANPELAPEGLCPH